MSVLDTQAESSAALKVRLLVVPLIGALIGLLAVLLVSQWRLNPLIAFAIPVAIGGLFLLLTRFEWVLIGVLASRTSLEPVFAIIKGSSDGMGPGAAINALVVLIGALFLLRQPRAFARAHLLLWIVFLAVAGTATRYAPDPAKAVRMLMIYLTYFVMFAVPVVLIRSQGDVGRWVKVLLSASIVPTIAGLVDMASGGIPVVEPDWSQGANLFNMPEYSGFRIQGAFSHPNIFAFYLVTLVGTLLYALRIGVFKGRGQYLAYAYLVLQGVLLLATQTRGAWAATAVVLLGYGLLIDRRMLGGLLFGGLSLLFVPVVQDRIVEIFAARPAGIDDALNSYEWRLAMWKSALPWIQDRWLLGWGLDAYAEYSPIFFPLEYLVGFDAHNVYVQLAFETGLVGAIAFAAIFVGLVVLALGWGRRRRLEAVLLATLALAYLMVCYSDNMHRYLVSNWYTFFFMGLLTVVMLRSDADPSEPSTRGSLEVAR